MIIKPFEIVNLKHIKEQRKLDYFMRPQKVMDRMVDEYKKYPHYIIAVDHDDTIEKWHSDGEHEMVRRLVRDCKTYLDAYIIIFTANRDENHVKSFWKEHSLPFDKINENSPIALEYFEKMKYEKEPRKIYYNVLLDDKAGLSNVYYCLQELIDLVKSNTVKKNK